MKHMQYAIPVD